MIDRSSMWPADMLPRAKIIYNDAVLRAELCWKEDCDCMREQRLSSSKEWADQVDMLSEQVDGIVRVEERIEGYWSKVQTMDMPRLKERAGEINNDRGMYKEDAKCRDEVVMKHMRGIVALCEKQIERIESSEEGNDTVLPTTEKMTLTLAQLQGDSEVLPGRQKTEVPKRPAMNEGECMSDLNAMGISMPATKIGEIFRRWNEMR